MIFAQNIAFGSTFTLESFPMLRLGPESGLQTYLGDWDPSHPGRSTSLSTGGLSLQKEEHVRIKEHLHWVLHFTGLKFRFSVLFANF